jgi:antitoxin component YwqK of YwqJK toxin-antitoxin module
VTRYINDKIDKIAIKYFKSGHIEGVNTYKNGELNGYCLMYFPNGNTYRQSVFENDKIISTITYNEAGKVVFDSSL